MADTHKMSHAGLAGIPEKKRRLKLQKELWLASNIQGWEIDPASIEICKREDGSDHLLGSGSYGQARSVAFLLRHE